MRENCKLAVAAVLAVAALAALGQPLPEMVLPRHPARTNNPAVELAWDASPDPTVTGYNLYCWDGLTNLVTQTPDIWGFVSNLNYGVTYQFTVTAVDEIGIESAPSNLVTYTPLPKTNVVVMVTGATGMTCDLVEWSICWEDPWIRTNEPGPWFFRGPGQLSITNWTY